MELKVIDNFLPEEIFQHLKEDIVFNPYFPLNMSSGVASKNDPDDNDNFYLTHDIYKDGEPVSDYYGMIQSVLVPITLNVFKPKSLLRARVNCYTHTPNIKEHVQHADYEFENISAILCLNTCDGFTRVGDHDIIESVENRFYMFDGSKLHNSSTTTNAKARYNINFNFL